jgi:hypothetical protein
MMKGLVHSHKYLGYLLALLPVIVVVLTIAGARTKPGLAKVVKGITRWGYNILGGLVILMGLGLWHGMDHDIGTLWIWAGLLLWVPVAITAKRMVGPECDAVMEGGEGSSRMLYGALIQLLCVMAIVALMTLRPF